jgi:Domain of unknown function (DUF4333)
MAPWRSCSTARPGALAALAGCALVAGCAGAGKVDSQQVDVKLLDYLHQTRPGVTVSVGCPSGVPVKSGATFQCSVSLDGAPTSYTVQVGTITGSRYDIEAQPTEPIFDTQQVAAAVKQQEGADTTVDCGKVRFVQVAVNGTFMCTVEVGGQTDTLTATVTDKQGGVSFASSTGSGASGSGASGSGTTPTTVAAPTGTLPGGG